MTSRISHIVPALCVGMQSEPLCGSGRWNVPDWVPTHSTHHLHIFMLATSFRQGLPESRLHGCIRLAILGTGYPLPGGYDETYV